ncbi:MAG: arginine--tRNA ligase [Planctomycetota bacterium]
MIDPRAHVVQRILEAVGELPDELRDRIALSPPKNKDHGDLAFGAFQVAKHKGEPPPKVAAEIQQALTQAAESGDEWIESASAAGPFVNIKLKREAIARQAIAAAFANAAPFGPAESNGRSIVVDFSSPNIAKPFHMGHLRSTVIGAALCRIHRHLGSEVHGVNHLGDWGMPFAKMMTAWMHFGDQAELEKNPMRHMFELYKRYGQAAKENPALDQEAAAHFQALESGEDNEERRMWKFLRDESLKAFQGPYDRLQVTFDHFTGESFYEDKIPAALERVESKGVLEKDEGADVVQLKELGIKVPCLLRKSDGTTLYHTRDLAAVFYRDETFHPDRILYVVGAEQKLHFQQLGAVLQKMNEPVAPKIEHVPFGLILAKNEESGKWEKFASRGGNAIFLDEVLDEAVAQVRKIIEEKNPDLADKDQVAEQIGVSAIVFNDLKNGRIKDVKFDWDQMLNFEGETGPYVQYAVARISGILRKCEVDPEDTSLGNDVDWSLLSDADQLLLTAWDFGPSVQRAAEQSEPSVITNYAIRLAGEVHSYLREHRVLDAEPATKAARIALVAAVRRVLKTALDLIGVAAPDEM